jgi:hypothetical protein
MDTPNDFYNEPVSEEEWFRNVAINMHKKLDAILATSDRYRLIDQFYEMCHDFERLE